MPNRLGGDPFTLKRKVLWENFSLGMLGDYSSSLTTCQLDDCFGVLGMSSPVMGKRPHQARGVSAATAAHTLRAAAVAAASPNVVAAPRREDHP
jgi:hypothetical protein